MVDELEIRKLIGEGYVDSIIKSLNDGETEKALKVSQELLNDNNGLMGGKDKVTFNDVVDSIKTYLTSELVNLLDDTLNDKTLDCIKQIAEGNGVDKYRDYKAEHVQTLSDKIGQCEKTIKEKNSKSYENRDETNNQISVSRMGDVAASMDGFSTAAGARKEELKNTQDTLDNVSRPKLNTPKAG
mgnify:CR=1 FL=1|tara:strand:- start:5382 stop:5936 length:555 start_codon:yes stop_codon:yes gene_type:complete